MYRFLFLTALFLSNTVIAGKSDVIERLQPYLPELSAEHIHNSQIDGFYEVLVQSPTLDVIYVSENGRYIIQGNITDLETMTNLSISRLNSLRMQLIEQIPEKDKIVFRADNEQYVIHVFTDVDCPYCVKLHANMTEMNALGITVKYLASPLEQLHPQAQYTMERIWCAEDRVQALHDYKTRRFVPDNEDCNNPVPRQVALAQQLGVTGTPSIFFENGSNLPGYQDPSALLQSIKQSLGQ